MPDEIKKIEFSNRIFILTSVLIIGILILCFLGIVIKFENLPHNYPREITVSGEGRIFTKPDIAIVDLGVKTEAINMKEVVNDNAKAMNEVIKTVKDLGVEEKDIKTINYTLTPRYEWTEQGERIFKGYVLKQEIRVKIRDFEKIGDILEKSSDAGANSIGDLSFSIDEPEKIREEARQKAIEQAKEKAATIAKQSGLKLVKLLNISEGYYPYYAAPTAKEAAGAGELLAAPQIQPGELDLTTTITLTYRVK